MGTAVAGERGAMIWREALVARVEGVTQRYGTTVALNAVAMSEYYTTKYLTSRALISK
jgi:hypothetical protein